MGTESKEGNGKAMKCGKTRTMEKMQWASMETHNQKGIDEKWGQITGGWWWVGQEQRWRWQWGTKGEDWLTEQRQWQITGGWWWVGWEWRWRWQWCTKVRMMVNGTKTMTIIWSTTVTERHSLDDGIQDDIAENFLQSPSTTTCRQADQDNPGSQ